MLTASEVAERLSAVRARIAAAAARARRDPGAVMLLLASKTQPPDAIRAAYLAGARDFGENYVQEAASKRDALADLADIRWHLIGHLQTNKAKAAVAIFEVIHSLDSARLASALHRARPQPPMRALIEVNLGGEATKTGVAPGAVEALIDAARDKVQIVGLMTIPPPARDPEASRPYFARLREMRDRLAAAAGLALSELSMGMTDDFEVAIEEGATIVRVGRAVFGERMR
ncbi:MAG TPA: YggS family pyridoxal phosphate-dependent enzyme [Candidatus Binataceae bacterium]|nr:YggS family pyridoxal phosphate-dependent enzyme [Candidatus Binataceae bacterium]